MTNRHSQGQPSKPWDPRKRLPYQQHCLIFGFYYFLEHIIYTNFIIVTKLRSWLSYYAQCEDEAVAGRRTEVTCSGIKSFNGRAQIFNEVALTPDLVLLMFLGFVLFKSCFLPPMFIAARSWTWLYFFQVACSDPILAGARSLGSHATFTMACAETPAGRTKFNT